MKAVALVTRSLDVHIGLVLRELGDDAVFGMDSRCPPCLGSNLQHSTSPFACLGGQLPTKAKGGFFLKFPPTVTSKQQGGCEGVVQNRYLRESETMLLFEAELE